MVIVVPWVDASVVMVESSAVGVAVEARRATGASVRRERSARIRADHGFVSVETTGLADSAGGEPGTRGTLTAREAEVLALVQRRLTNAEIAEQLFVSVRTVETHVSSLLRKLGASDRRALAAIGPPRRPRSSARRRRRAPSGSAPGPARRAGRPGRPGRRGLGAAPPRPAHHADRPGRRGQDERGPGRRPPRRRALAGGAVFVDLVPARTAATCSGRSPMRSASRATPPAPRRARRPPRRPFDADRDGQLRARDRRRRRARRRRARLRRHVAHPRHQPRTPRPRATSTWCRSNRSAPPPPSCSSNGPAGSNRASPGTPRTTQIVDLCARLDGLPLAVELAAGQVRRWSLAELSRRLGDPAPRLPARRRPRRTAAPDDDGRHRLELRAAGRARAAAAPPPRRVPVRASDSTRARRCDHCSTASTSTGAGLAGGQEPRGARARHELVPAARDDPGVRRRAARRVRRARRRLRAPSAVDGRRRRAASSQARPLDVRPSRRPPARRRRPRAPGVLVEPRRRPLRRRRRARHHPLVPVAQRRRLRRGPPLARRPRRPRSRAGIASLGRAAPRRHRPGRRGLPDHDRRRRGVGPARRRPRPGRPTRWPNTS